MPELENLISFSCKMTVSPFFLEFITLNVKKEINSYTVKISDEKIINVLSELRNQVIDNFPILKDQFEQSLIL
jgi:hypothetical protein